MPSIATKKTVESHACQFKSQGFCFVMLLQDISIIHDELAKKFLGNYFHVKCKQPHVSVVVISHVSVI